MSDELLGLLSSYVFWGKGLLPKHHTIRSGSRFKVGDVFSPRVWGDDVNSKSGKRGPYQSKQIIIAPDLEIKMVWNFEFVVVNTSCFNILLNGKEINHNLLFEIAKNDGLSCEDLVHWLGKKSFKGQIICWNQNISYNANSC